MHIYRHAYICLQDDKDLAELVNSLRANVHNHAAALAACQAMARLTYTSDDRKAAVAAAGGIEAVVRVMGEHQANAAVMEEACWALANLACLDANRARIGAADQGHVIRPDQFAHAVTQCGCEARLSQQGGGFTHNP